MLILSWLAMQRKHEFFAHIKANSASCLRNCKAGDSQQYFMLTLCNRFCQSCSSGVGKGTRVKKWAYILVWSSVVCLSQYFFIYFYTVFFLLPLYRFTKAYNSYDKLNILNCTFKVYNLINCAINHTFFWIFLKCPWLYLTFEHVECGRNNFQFSYLGILTSV